MKITTKELIETKNFLENGNILKNEVVGYQILIRKDGTRIFYFNGEYKFFKNINSFIKATIKIIKTGGL